MSATSVYVVTGKRTKKFPLYSERENLQFLVHIIRLLYSLGTLEQTGPTSWTNKAKYIQTFLWKMDLHLFWISRARAILKKIRYRCVWSAFLFFLSTTVSICYCNRTDRHENDKKKKKKTALMCIAPDVFPTPPAPYGCRRVGGTHTKGPKLTGCHRCTQRRHHPEKPNQPRTDTHTPRR